MGRGPRRGFRQHRARPRQSSPRARLGLDADGRFLALDVATIANLGAYMSGGGPGSSTNAPANAMGGGYVIPAIAMDVRAAFTNTVPIDAYRGAGKPEANYLLERLIDLAARRHGFDPAELRRRNMIAIVSISQRRWAASSTAAVSPPTSTMSLAVADRRGFRRPPRRHPKQRGLLRGLGLCCFMETARGAPNEGAEIRFGAEARWNCWSARNRTGRATRPAIRKSPPTCLACRRRRSATPRVTPAQVRAGNGHGGARSMHMGGAAMFRAAQRGHRQRHRRRRRCLLQAKPEEVRFDAGAFIAGDRAIGLLDVAREASLDTYVWNLLDIITFPNGCHIAEVEVDPDTGLVTLDRYHGGRRLRHLDQSDADHRSGAWRPGAGHRPGAAGAHGLRSRIRASC